MITPYVEIIPTPEQVEKYKQVGLERKLASKGFKPAAGFIPTEDDLWMDEMGAGGELAASIALKMEELWVGPVNNFKEADIASNIQVRTAKGHNRSLTIRPGDVGLTDHVFVHVTYEDGKFRVHGTCLGRDGMKEEYLNDLGHPERPLAYKVPMYVLTPINGLKRRTKKCDSRHITE